MEGRNQRPESSWKPGAGGLCATRSNGGKIHGRERRAAGEAAAGAGAGLEGSHGQTGREAGELPTTFASFPHCGAAPPLRFRSRKRQMHPARWNVD